MTTMTVYISFDGVEFGTEAECRKYEGKIMELRQWIHDNVVFSYLDDTPFTMQVLTEGFWEWFDKLYNQSDSLIIKEDTPDKVNNYLYHEEGICLPEEKGTYTYDNDHMYWRKEEA